MLIDPPRLGRSKSAPYLGVARLAVRVLSVFRGVTCAARRWAR